MDYFLLMSNHSILSAADKIRLYDIINDCIDENIDEEDIIQALYESKYRNLYPKYMLDDIKKIIAVLYEYLWLRDK